MTSQTNMLRYATSHDFATEKLILIEKQVPVPMDKSPQKLMIQELTSPFPSVLIPYR